MDVPRRIPFTAEFVHGWDLVIKGPEPYPPGLEKNCANFNTPFVPAVNERKK